MWNTFYIQGTWDAEALIANRPLHKQSSVVWNVNLTLGSKGETVKAGLH